MSTATIEVLQNVARTYGGSHNSPLGRCIYNLKLIQKIPLVGDTETKCGRMCNGSSRLNGSLNLCDFYTDSQFYFLEFCAWHVRADRIRVRHEFLGEDDLNPDEERCLNCHATLEQGCSGYVNVRHVVDEICAKKAHLENELKRGNLPILEQYKGDGCAGCPGESQGPHDCQGSSGYCSMRELYEFWKIFPQTKPASQNQLVTIAS
ncbi:MAG: hypothetical protein AABX54_04575 [Nanoarchaeota archaeon]